MKLPTQNPSKTFFIRPLKYRLECGLILVSTKLSRTCENFLRKLEQK